MIFRYHGDQLTIHRRSFALHFEFCGLRIFPCQLVAVAEKNSCYRKICSAPAVLAVHGQVRQAHNAPEGIFVLPQSQVYRPHQTVRESDQY